MGVCLSVSFWRDGTGLIKLWETLGKPLGTLTQNYFMSQDENTQSLWYSLILSVLSNTKCQDTGDQNLSPKPTIPTVGPTSGGSHLFTSFTSMLCQGGWNFGRWAVRALMAPPPFAAHAWHGIQGGTDHQFVPLNYPVWMVFCWTLTSGTIKCTTSHHSCFESLGMWMDVKYWQSIDTWIHFEHLFLSSLKHHVFSYRVNVLGL